MSELTEKIYIKANEYYPPKELGRCNEMMVTLAKIFAKKFYEGYEEILFEAFQMCIATCGSMHVTIERKAKLFRPEIRRYTMSLSLGPHTLQPAYVKFSGNAFEREKEEAAAKHIGALLLLPELLMSFFDKEVNGFELDNFILKGLDHAFISIYLATHALQSADSFSTSHDVLVPFEHVDQEQVELIVHRIDIEKVRFFLKGGEERIVSYAHMMSDKKQPLFSLLEQWKTKGKRYMEYNKGAAHQ